MTEISNDTIKNLLDENVPIDEAIEAGVREYQELFGFTTNLPRGTRTSEWLRSFGKRVAQIALQRPSSS